MRRDVLARGLVRAVENDSPFVAPPLGASNRILREESERLGFRVTVVSGADTVLVHEGHGLRFFTRCTQTSVQSSVGRTIALDKALTKALLVRAGLPTARGFLAHGVADLHRLVELDPPYVVKPVDGKQGTGVRLGLGTIDEVRACVEAARGPQVIEEMLVGLEHRVLVIDGEVVAAACRRPAFVIGDGVRTVAELVAEKNRHPWRGEGHVNNLTRIAVDDEVRAHLESAGATLDTVPPAGIEIALRGAANLSLGGEASDVTDLVGDENRALFAAVARTVDLDVVGIDVVCSSISEPIVAQQRAGIAAQSRCGIVEVNASPGLRMHHFPMSGTPRNVGRLLLEHVIRRLGGRR